MLKTRLIPVLLLQEGFLVRSERFSIHQKLGLPFEEVRRLNEWNVDELIYLDITRPDARNQHYDVMRNDHRDKSVVSELELLEAISETCFMPLTFGGRIRSIDDMHQRFKRGADKVTINTMLHDSPELVREAAHLFGNQALVASIDVKVDEDDRPVVWTHCGTKSTKTGAVEWARYAESLGAGEILLQSIDRDGTGRGYDLKLIQEVCDAVTIPVIALGGVGTYEHYPPAIRHGASAVAAANIFHFKELSDRNAKRTMKRFNLNVRF